MAIGVMVLVFSLHADIAVRCTQNGPNQLVCRVDEPNVTQRVTDYRQINFRPGDRVSVTAGGCVQTGGSGPTWKRYVNPSGPNSNRMYWGTISIPGATTGLVRFSDVLGRSLTVPTGIADSDLYLKLGYLDDDYSDNGYWGHDDGTENQCKGVGNAFATLTIDRSPATPVTCAGTTGNKPLDLVWTECDPNGFPKNPRWRYQVDQNGLIPPAPSELCPSGVASCTSWPITNDSGALCGPHVNWFAATYQGVVDWEDKSTNGTDDDYNYRMFPPHDEGVLTHQDLTINGMESEFDSEETIDNFTSPLWSAFHKLVKDNNAAAQTAVKGKMAVITGLLGLDCGHPDCSSELHPAYAFAVNRDDSNLADDQWTIFARNWGDEGFCSSHDHNLPVTNLKVLVPWLPGAASVTVGPDTQFYIFANSGSNTSVPSPQITIAQGQGVLIDFSLPDPSAQLGVEGELHLQWTISPADRLRLGATRSSLIAAIRRSNKPEIAKPETRIAALMSKLSATQVQALQNQVKAAAAARLAAPRQRLQLRPATRVASLPAPPRLAKPIATQAAPNPLRVQKSESLRVALCEAYKNSVPGYPSMCSTTVRDHR
ncbi:MAG: hypothetical protein ACR2NN_21955 [Bryobacteraceae bacterium]